MNIIDWLFNDKHGNKVIAQKPNLPIWIAIILYTLANTISEDFVIYGQFVLAIWAIFELALGVNPFRRILGAGLLVYLAIQFL